MDLISSLQSCLCCPKGQAPKPYPCPSDMIDLSSLTHCEWHKHAWLITLPLAMATSHLFAILYRVFLLARWNLPPRSSQLLQLPSFISPAYRTREEKTGYMRDGHFTAHFPGSCSTSSARWPECLPTLCVGSYSLGEEKPELAGRARQAPKRVNL